MALEIAGLKKTYGNFSVSLDLSVNKGETLVLAGPSGCGKTTALNLIAGIVTADLGKVFLDGKDISAIEPWKRNVSMVFQDMSLFPHLDVGGNIAYGLVIRGVKKKDRLAAIEEALETVRLAGYAKRRVHTLSGGERQRVAIARALAVKPGVLLMDEPFSSLDLPLRKELRAEFLEIRGRQDAPCIFVTHDREEALMLGSSLSLMKGGKIVESGTGRDLFLSPKTTFAASFFGAGLVLPCKIIRRSRGEGCCPKDSLVEVSTPLGAMIVPGGLQPEDGQVNLFIPREAVCLQEEGTDARNKRIFTALCTGSFFNGQNLVVKLSMSGVEIEIAADPRMKAPAVASATAFTVDESLLRFVKINS